MSLVLRTSIVVVLDIPVFDVVFDSISVAMETCRYGHLDFWWVWLRLYKYRVKFFVLITEYDKKVPHICVEKDSVTCAAALTAHELTESSLQRLLRKLLLTKQYMKKLRELKEGSKPTTTIR